MKITITVKANAKQAKVEELAAGEFRVHVKEPPREGRANEAVIKAIAEHFHVPKNRVAILAGQGSKRKIVGVNE